MFSSKYNKIVLEALDENIEILEQYIDGEGKLILKVNGKPVSVLEYEIYGNHCCLEFLETYIEENEGKGYATKLVNKLKEILKNSGIKTISANATTKSQHILKKVFGEPVSKKEFGWDEGIGDDLWSVKHNINESYLVEARSEYLLNNQKLVNQIADRYVSNYLTSAELDRWQHAEDRDQKSLKLVKTTILDRIENSQHPFISKYLLWVMKQYANGYWIFPEDVKKLEKELELFSKFSHTLEKKDINQYSFDEFSKLVLDLEGKYTANEKERMIKDNEAEKVFENENWLLIHPKTQDAAILYGKGTRWCTASTDGYNYFNHYNDQGPLYILISKKDPNIKYQFHWQSNQFMNVTDRTISKTEKESILADPELHAKLREIVNQNYSPESYAEALYDSCGIDVSPSFADKIKPDENGICHLTIIDSVFENMYDTNTRDGVYWKLIDKVFTGEGLFEEFYDYGDYVGDFTPDLTDEQFKAISKILVDNNLPTIPQTTLEYLMAGQDHHIPEEYQIYEEIFEYMRENSEYNSRISDCYATGAEIEAYKDIEDGIIDYLSNGGYNPHFEWESLSGNGTKHEERVIYMDVPAKDLNFPLTNEISIFPTESSEYNESFGEYLVNTLYDGEECCIYEPGYGWSGFDEESWNEYISTEYIPELKELIEKDPERNKKIKKEWNEMNSQNESTIQRAVNIIVEKNVQHRSNTFSKVFTKINEKELDEGKFGRTLGALATAATIGLGGLHTDNAQAAQYNPNNQEQVLNYKFAAQRDIPEWIEHTGELSTENGKLYFTAETIGDENADNTAHLERVAQLKASSQLVDTLKRAVNSKISGQLNSIEGSITVSKLKPSKSFWLLMKPKGEAKEYHAYSRVEIDQNDITTALTNALKKANPQANTHQLQKIVQDSIQSIMS